MFEISVSNQCGTVEIVRTDEFWGLIEMIRNFWLINKRGACMRVFLLIVALSVLTSAVVVADRPCCVGQLNNISDKPVANIDDETNDVLPESLRDLDRTPLDISYNDLVLDEKQRRIMIRTTMIEASRLAGNKAQRLRFRSNDRVQDFRNQLEDCLKHNKESFNQVLYTQLIHINVMSQSDNPDDKRNAAIAALLVANAYSNELKEKELAKYIVMLFAIQNWKHGHPQSYKYDSKWNILCLIDGFFKINGMHAERMALLRAKIQEAPNQNHIDGCHAEIASLYLSHGYKLHGARELLKISDSTSLSEFKLVGYGIVETYQKSIDSKNDDGPEPNNSSED